MMTMKTNWKKVSTTRSGLAAIATFFFLSFVCSLLLFANVCVRNVLRAYYINAMFDIERDREPIRI